MTARHEEGGIKVILVTTPNNDCLETFTNEMFVKTALQTNDCNKQLIVKTFVNEKMYASQYHTWHF